MKKIILGSAEIDRLASVVVNFLNYPQQVDLIVANALESTMTPRTKVKKCEARTLVGAQKEFFGSNPHSSKEKAAILRCISLAKTEDDLIGIYEYSLCKRVKDGSLEIKLLIRKMAKILFRC